LPEKYWYAEYLSEKPAKTYSGNTKLCIKELKST
jgi:hypothetical protein